MNKKFLEKKKETDQVEFDLDNEHLTLKTTEEKLNLLNSRVNKNLYLDR